MRVRRIAVLIDGAFFLKGAHAPRAAKARRAAVLLDGVVHHPLLNRRMDFGKSDVALFRRALFADLRRKRKFALRLGHVSRDSDEAASAPREQILCELREVIAAWRVITERDVILGLRQKGVDMRIGLDIASMTLKHQVDTIILVTGDSDFAPAAKLARREGVEFLLDPLWQRVSDELTEHVDGVVSVFPKPAPDIEALMAA